MKECHIIRTSTEKNRQESDFIKLQLKMVEDVLQPQPILVNQNLTFKYLLIVMLHN